MNKRKLFKSNATVVSSSALVNLKMVRKNVFIY